ncbi:MAG: hypothetical protein EZS28_008852 [Streblomastix strix]|uniref:Uncharacterized protein n=1 Tax=Streblomastix strix TaxID=222440 RepID=A0A5J4WLA4_9EUKA|nr:MAG: hypothetical protein EZS28_008852 [Streblomastix strix]
MQHRQISKLAVDNVIQQDNGQEMPAIIHGRMRSRSFLIEQKLETGGMARKINSIFDGNHSIKAKLLSCITSSREGEFSLCLLDSGHYGFSSYQTFTMGISIQQQSSSSGTGNKYTPYLNRVRRYVLRLPEFKIHEILAILQFQVTGFEPEDPDYEVKRKEPDSKRLKVSFFQTTLNAILGWLGLMKGIKLRQNMTQWIRKNLNCWNCYLSSRKSTNRQRAKDLQETNNLNIRRGKIDQNIINRQVEAISLTDNGLEGLGRTHEADQIIGANQGPSLSLVPSLGYYYTNHIVNLTKDCKGNWSTLQRQKAEVSSQSQQDQGAGDYRTLQIDDGEMGTYDQPRSLQNSQVNRWLSFGSFEINQEKGITDQAHYGHILNDTKCCTQVESDQKVCKLIWQAKKSCSESWKPNHFLTNAGSP